MAHLNSGGASGLPQEAGVVVGDPVVSADVRLSGWASHPRAAGLFGHAEAEVHGGGLFVAGQRVSVGEKEKNSSKKERRKERKRSENVI